MIVCCKTGLNGVDCGLPIKVRRASTKAGFGWDSLTETERSVAELVAQGLTNRRIASKLFISPYTVDAHLRHIFQKLDISSRVDLVRIATARAVADSTLVA